MTVRRVKTTKIELCRKRTGYFSLDLNGNEDILEEPGVESVGNYVQKIQIV